WVQSWGIAGRMMEAYAPIDVGRRFNHRGARRTSQRYPGEIPLCDSVKSFEYLCGFTRALTAISVSLSLFPAAGALDGERWRSAFAEADALLRHGRLGGDGAELIHFADPRVRRFELLDGCIDARTQGGGARAGHRVGAQELDLLFVAL